MNAELKEEWQEWLREGKTQAFLRGLKRRAQSLQTQWLEQVWGGLDPSQGNLPECRAQSLAYEQLGNIGLEQIEELLGHEHDGNRADRI